MLVVIILVLFAILAGVMLWSASDPINKEPWPHDWNE